MSDQVKADDITQDLAPKEQVTKSDTEAHAIVHEDKPAEAKKSVEEWREEKKTELVKFAAAKGLSNWPVGAELTEGEYDAAIEAGFSHPIGQ